ncbi:transcriptional regulator [Chroococcidiopsis sp. FACHB-1243]|uniref:helix-turn-helix transcriptional regulator n=1 Tax=Chroococcidiopsis sp. [FACHB-1243] TaxID=2692781 RepID=UPI0017862434|nr:metalloregulator ArsR/SmtB family transcription factor [Chroococcidiopsis sp. [FACHB-1243]]MBD2307429.1 transcriptional regulator [Chroococcidiopsis sp. [FACHB-1243]]
MNDAIERVRVKNQILSVIKMHGSQTAVDLATKLQVSPMAIRQHMQTLQDEQLVTYSEQKQAVGRPVKFWQLTEKANALFPNHHADLVVKLIEGVRKVFGEAGLKVLIGERTQAQIQTYSAQMEHARNWRERVAILTQLRTQEGYMAETIEESPGVLLLAENHCSICAAAQSCSQLCSSELQVFETLLGSDVNVERVEHILSGDRRCAYRISGCN